MGHPSLAPVLPSAPPLPKRNGAALERLLRALQDHQPVVVLVGEGSIVARCVIDAFAAAIHETADVVRLPGSSLNPERCMDSIVRGVGFDPDGLAMDDLRQIVKMFLDYQKKHRRHTVLCIEDAHEADSWTLDLLNELVESELENRYGLMVLFAGERELHGKLAQSELDIFARSMHPCIDVAPLDLEETRRYLQKRLRDEGYELISGVFEFDAVTRIHDISAGVPETMDRLVDGCLEKAKDQPLTAEMVESVARALKLVASVDEDEALFAELGVPTGGRLIVRKNGDEIARCLIEKERLLIGRSARCDLRLGCGAVSRNHAAILWTKSGVSIVDLGSTNGTIVDGDRIQSYPLSDGIHIRVGDCDVEYQAPG